MYTGLLSEQEVKIQLVYAKVQHFFTGPSSILFYWKHLPVLLQFPSRPSLGRFEFSDWEWKVFWQEQSEILL